MGTADASLKRLRTKVLWYLTAYHEQIHVKAEEYKSLGLNAKSDQLVHTAEEIAQVVEQVQALKNLEL